MVYCVRCLSPLALPWIAQRDRVKNTTTTLLDEARVALSLGSDYALARKLGVRQQTLTNYRSGRTQMSDAIALKIALLLKRVPAAVFAEIAAERSKDAAVAAIWREAAALLASTESKRRLAKGRP